MDAALIALGKNPLPGAIVVYPDTDQLEDAAIRALATALGALPGVERVQADLRWVRRLQAAVALAQLVAILLAGFLLLTAMLVIANTIRLELSRRRNELEVSRLLGASGGFLARPVIYAGAVYGFLGALSEMCWRCSRCSCCADRPTTWHGFTAVDSCSHCPPLNAWA